MKIFLKDALAKMVMLGKQASDVFDAVEQGIIQVHSTLFVTQQLVTSDWSRIDSLIYFDPKHMDDDAGFLTREDIESLPIGRSQIDRPPYCHVLKWESGFTTYIPSTVPIRSVEDVLIGHEFLRKAKLLPNGAAFVDDLSINERQYANDLTVTKITSIFQNPVPQPKIVERAFGRPAIYSDPECDKTFIAWQRANPVVGVMDQRRKLREIYEDAGKSVATDKAFKAERRKIDEILKSQNRTKIAF